MDDHANDETTETEQLEQLPAVADSAPSSAMVLVEAYKAAGTQRLTEEQEAILLAPVEPENDVELHLIDGPYVPWIKYTQRLNTAFGLMGWARLRMGEPDFDPDSMTAAIRVALKIEGRVVRDAVGECKQGSKKMTRFDCLEGAMKNGLKRCCSDLGMFSELQDRRWREQWLVKHARRVKKDGYEQWERLGVVPAPTPVQRQPPPSPGAKKADLPQAFDLPTEGFVRKVEGPTTTGAYTLTVETENGEVRLLGNSSLNKYPDKTQLLDLLVEFTTKEVPQKGGGRMVVLNSLEVKGEQL